MASYGSIPRKCDRAKTYLYLKNLTGKLFEIKNAKRNDQTTRTLLLASLDNDYVEGCAQTLHICGQTVRNHLKKQDPNRLLKINKEIIQEMKRKGALNKPLTLAADWHDEMYYGDPNVEGVVGAMPKKGSCRAYRFATISVLHNGQRLTLAAVPMLDRCILWHVKHLLSRVFELGLTVKLLLLDRGYFSTALIRYLNESGVKFIMHMPWHGKPLEAGSDLHYTTTTHKRRVVEQASFRVVAVQRKGKVLVFATNTSFGSRRLKKMFRKRWGIETSYRMIRLFLAKTTSKRYELRKLYFFLAVVLYNLWVSSNFRCRRVTVHALKVEVTLSLVLSWLPDVESGG
jgi:Transposase DDE domain